MPQNRSSAVIKYAKHLADAIISIQTIPGMDMSVETELLKETTKLLRESQTALKTLQEKTEAAALIENNERQARYYHDEVNTAMELCANQSTAGNDRRQRNVANAILRRPDVRSLNKKSNQLYKNKCPQVENPLPLTGHSYVAKHRTKKVRWTFLVEHKICQCMKMATL